MTINGINGTNTQIGMNQATDSYSRSIQNQIADAQKQLQELTSNKDMTQEEKMMKRQELQQQISDLNMQLRQHQMEKRMQERQKNANSFDDMVGGDQKAGNAGNADMGVLISLSTTKEQIAGMKKVRTDLEGKLRTAQTEEEKTDLQEKIDGITQNISDKIKETQDTIADNQKSDHDKADKAKDKKEDEKEDETNAVLEKENGSVEVKPAESVDTGVQVQTE